MSRFRDELTMRSAPHPPTLDVDKTLPINLLRKAIRERRNAGLPQKVGRKKKKKTTTKPIENPEFEAILQNTEAEMCRILASSDVLSDIPHDYTETELLGEIAQAQGTATTIYIQRDGLSTLTILLPQASPTIANLKRAIEIVSRAQLQRELRERHEERQRRRRQQRQHAMEYKTTSITAKANTPTLQHGVERMESETAASTVTNVLPQIKSTGELVYSTACSGHQHRSTVSWRFLWRAYALFDLNTNKPLDDRVGNKLLSEYGIENGSVLKFCNREKYFGRKRQ